MLNIRIKKVVNASPPHAKCPYRMILFFIFVAVVKTAPWLACKHHTFPLHRPLFRICPALTLEVWLRNWSSPFAVASKLVYLPLALPLPISFSWELSWPGGKGGGHRPGVGQVFPYREQLVRSTDTLIADIIWGGMEWLGQSQLHWYSRVFSAPVGHLDNIFIWIYAARNNSKENTTLQH